MNEQLEHLRLIFGEDRFSTKELQQILSKYNNNVELAVDAILSLNNGEYDETQQQQQQQDDDDVFSLFDNHHQQHQQQHQHQHQPIGRPTMVALPPLLPSPPNASTTPTTSTTATTSNDGEISQQERRNRRLHEASRAALEREENELNEALRTSLEPSNRGLEYLSDDDLAELILNDPVFLATLDDRDLSTAMALQAKLEAAEQEHQSWKDNNSNNSTGQQQRPPDFFLPSISNLTGTAISSLQQRQRLRKLGAQFVRAGRMKLNMPSNQESDLAQQLERVNRENEEEHERRRIRLEAKAAMMEAVREHLASFVQEHPTASYEEWIQDLHPENAHDGDILLPGHNDNYKNIDRRFYVVESEHRILWNRSIDNNNEESMGRRVLRNPVVALHDDNSNNNNTSSDDAPPVIVDLLS